MMMAVLYVLLEIRVTAVMVRVSGIETGIAFRRGEG